jgi:hypothetical protein
VEPGTRAPGRRKQQVAPKQCAAGNVSDLTIRDQAKLGQMEHEKAYKIVTWETQEEMAGKLFLVLN